MVGLYSSQALLAEHLSVARMTLRGGVAFLGDQIGSLLLHAAGFLLIWGVIDLAQARRRYTNELKMTKQEIREEHRQNDGSPEVKMRIRRLRRELLRRRMMSQVEEATAVVTNPTHYAVALKYDFGSSGAPRVVAKGKNFLALRIRQRAAEHQVPVIETRRWRAPYTRLRMSDQRSRLICTEPWRKSWRTSSGSWEECRERKGDSRLWPRRFPECACRNASKRPRRG